MTPAATAVRGPRDQPRYVRSLSLERFLRSKYGVRSEPRSGVSAEAPRKAAKLGILALTVLLFGALAFEGQAHADVLLAKTGVFVGDAAAQYSMNVSTAGTLSLNLVDFAWPAPLANLSLEVTSGTQILGQLSGSGTETLSLSGPGTYYALVTGTATGPLNLGAYGLLANFEASNAPTPVPLPASLSLLLGGLATVLWSARRKPRGGKYASLAGAAV